MCTCFIIAGDGGRKTEHLQRNTVDGMQKTGDGRREIGYGRWKGGRRNKGDGRLEAECGRLETHDPICQFITTLVLVLVSGLAMAYSKTRRHDAAT